MKCFFWCHEPPNTKPITCDFLLVSIYLLVSNYISDVLVSSKSEKTIYLVSLRKQFTTCALFWFVVLTAATGRRKKQLRPVVYLELWSVLLLFSLAYHSALRLSDLLRHADLDIFVELGIVLGIR